jgi:broad-specificity NMP kinase
MLDKYNEYISCEDEARQKMLVSVGVDYDMLDEVLSDEEVILEELETVLANHDEVIALSKEQSEMIAEMRKSLFSKIYDFEKGEFKT